MSLERPHAWWPWIGGKAVDGPGDGPASGRIQVAERAAGTGPDVDAVGGHEAEPYRERRQLQAKLGLDLLPGNRLAGLVHGRVGLGSVLCVFSGPQGFDERFGDDGGHPLAADG